MSATEGTLATNYGRHSGTMSGLFLVGALLSLPPAAIAKEGEVNGRSDIGANHVTGSSWSAESFTNTTSGWQRQYPSPPAEVAGPSKNALLPAVAEFYNTLESTQQEPNETAIAAVYDNLWDLYGE